MPKCKVVLTANAGVVIVSGGLKIFCDALHRKKTTDYFSTLSPQMQQRMTEDALFQNPDLIFYTHKHPDHYSFSMTQAVRERSPDALVVSPIEELEGQVLLTESTHNLSFGGAEFEFKHLRHDGKEYADLPNYGCIMNLSGFKILVLGDCFVGNPNLISWVKDADIDLALLNFPWLTLRAGREFIARHIKPKHVMFYHLPFAEDDNNGFRSAAAKSLPLLTAPADARLLQEPFQIEAID